MSKLKRNKSNPSTRGWTAADLRPGDLFNYPNGNPDKVYMVVEDGEANKTQGMDFALDDDRAVVELFSGQAYQMPRHSKPIVRIEGTLSYSKD